jgi:hypothetical protein
MKKVLLYWEKENIKLNSGDCSNFYRINANNLIIEEKLHFCLIDKRYYNIRTNNMKSYSNIEQVLAEQDLILKNKYILLNKKQSDKLKVLF